MKQRHRPSRLTFRLLESAFGLAFLGTVVHHVVAHDLRPLLALCAPILLVYYGFTSLLFVRGRSLTPGPWQVRSLHAAEHAMRATIWHLFGIILGMSIYGLLRYLRVAFDASQTWHAALWLVMFSAPYVLMQVGLLCFMRSVWVLSPDFAGPMSAFRIGRRIQQRRSVAERDEGRVGESLALLHGIAGREPDRVLSIVNDSARASPSR